MYWNPISAARMCFHSLVTTEVTSAIAVVAVVGSLKADGRVSPQLYSTHQPVVGRSETARVANYLRLA
jgi:hypothetical protein